VVQLANPAEIEGGGIDVASGYLYSPQALTRRLEKVRAKMEEMGVDSLLLTHPDNRRYMSGFSGHDQPPLDTAGFLLIGPNDLCLITDGRYGIQASRELAPELGISLAVHIGKLIPTVTEQIKNRNCKRLGFESAHLIHLWWQQLGEALPDSKLVPTKSVVEPLRMVKDEDELRILRRAIAISDEAFNIVSRRIEVGMTEKQVAWDIERTMRELGADERAFGSIVAAGPNGALAHAVPGDRPIREGEPIVIDMGAKLEGYSSDMTRTICLGEPTDKFREIYNIVLEAHLRAERELKPGMSGREADALSRDVIEGAGYGEQFTHSLGHGIGLEVHEGPSLRKTVEDTIPEGAVTSVEPGIYIEGWGGVRIEDLVLFRHDGVEVLTQADKQDFMELVVTDDGR
jgi:Xaa-Pro aminopeptidase